MNQKYSIYLKGGFGNVLFQLIYYFSLVDKGYSPLLIDSLTNKNILTKFLGWKIHDKAYSHMFGESELMIKKQPIYKTLIIMALGKLSKKFKKPICSVYFFSEVSNNDMYLNSSSYIFGYFQSKIFLEQNKNSIKKIVKKLNKSYLSKKEEDQYIAIHYRYGDSIWARKNEEYYKLVKKNITNKNRVIILTDSKDRAKVFFEDLVVSSLVILSNSPLVDFSYMVSAKELYCAPSTFSWWAAQCLSKTKSVYLPPFFENKLGFYGDSKFKYLK